MPLLSYTGLSALVCPGSFAPGTYKHFLLLRKTLGALSSPSQSEAQVILTSGWAGNAVLSRVKACRQYRDGKAWADSTFYLV